MSTVTWPRVHPFSRCGWRGRLQSVDGTPAHDFHEDDPATMLYAGDSGDRWDGDSAGVARLSDGRVVGWETYYGPTGDGFCHDAYGGDALIFVGATVEVVAYLGLGSEGRALCGLPEIRSDFTPDMEKTCLA